MECSAGGETHISQVSPSQSDMSFWNTRLILPRGLMNRSDYSTNSYLLHGPWSSLRLVTHSVSTDFSQVDTNLLCVSTVFHTLSIMNYFNALFGEHVKMDTLYLKIIILSEEVLLQNILHAFTFSLIWEKCL